MYHHPTASKVTGKGLAIFGSITENSVRISLFTRTSRIWGDNVTACHPPASRALTWR